MCRCRVRCAIGTQLGRARWGCVVACPRPFAIYSRRICNLDFHLSLDIHGLLFLLPKNWMFAGPPINKSVAAIPIFCSNGVEDLLPVCPVCCPIDYEIDVAEYCLKSWVFGLSALKIIEWLEFTI
ncbi:hypothetical protein ACLOJK_004698 [Asimina triloba]